MFRIASRSNYDISVPSVVSELKTPYGKRIIVVILAHSFWYIDDSMMYKQIDVELYKCRQLD